MKRVLLIANYTGEKLDNYINALKMVGIESDYTDTYKSSESYDGLIVCGGIDVHPSLYNKQIDERVGKTDIAYDQECIKTIDEFYKKDKPILGVCRGLQILNVYFKGTLFFDIKGHNNLYHDINVKKDGFLYNLYGSKMKVNSHHHQAIDLLGKGLEVIATHDDGTIEAITDNKKIIAIQWHPEKDINTGIKIFEYYKNIL